MVGQGSVLKTARDKTKKLDSKSQKVSPKKTGAKAKPSNTSTLQVSQMMQQKEKLIKALVSKPKKTEVRTMIILTGPTGNRTPIK